MSLLVFLVIKDDMHWQVDSLFSPWASIYSWHYTTTLIPKIWDSVKQNRIWSFANPLSHINALINFSQICAYLEFDASNKSEAGWDGDSKRLGNLWNAPNTPVTPGAFHRFTANRWRCHDKAWEVHAQKGSQTRMRRKVQHCVRHIVVSDITTELRDTS